MTTCILKARMGSSPRYVKTYIIFLIFCVLKLQIIITVRSTSRGSPEVRLSKLKIIFYKNIRKLNGCAVKNIIFIQPISKKIYQTNRLLHRTKTLYCLYLPFERIMCTIKCLRCDSWRFYYVDER